jgi:Zn-dependent protease
MDPVGMVYASKRKVRMRVAATIANTAASTHSRQTAFLFLVVVVVVSVVVSFFVQMAIWAIILFKSNNFPYNLLYGGNYLDQYLTIIITVA